MTIVLAVGFLLSGILMGTYVLYAHEVPSLPLPSERVKHRPRTRFSKSLMMFADSANCPLAKQQRREIKNTLPLFLKNGFRIYEVYGHLDTSCNGEEVKDLDHGLLRRSFNAEHGFSLVYVNSLGQQQFQTMLPIPSNILILLTGMGLKSALATLDEIKNVTTQDFDHAVGDKIASPSSPELDTPPQHKDHIVDNTLSTKAIRVHGLR